jgi:predicted choloylglycine hydrolase
LIAERSSPRVRVFEGSYYDIGLRMGAALRTLQVPRADDELVSLARRCEALAGQAYPPILDKVEGMIEGGRLKSRDFKAFFYARDALPQVGCTNLAVLPSYTSDGSLIVARNYDWYYYSKEWYELRRIGPEGAFRTLSVTHHWAGSPDGLNDQGLGIFLAVLPQLHSGRPGLQWHLVTDIVLDACENVGEACDFIASVPHLGAFNYLVVDRHGQAVVAEAFPTGVSIREPEDGFIIATNHLPGREAPEEGLSPDDRRRQRRSLTRYRRAEEMLQGKRGQVDEGIVKRLLREHQAPICRGNHDPPDDGTSFDDVFGTIWSLIARLEKTELLLAWGHPCRSEYRKYGLY